METEQGLRMSKPARVLIASSERGEKLGIWIRQMAGQRFRRLCKMAGAVCEQDGAAGAPLARFWKVVERCGCST